MKNTNNIPAKLYRLMNHDNPEQEPKWESYSLDQYNSEFGTNHASIDEAVEDDPEYLFTESQMDDFSERY